jgi:hypothetical protein
MEHAFRGRKSYATQNVMAAVDFDLRFTYVLAGWEGTANCDLCHMHPHIARAFNKLPFDHKLIWARNFVSEKFPGV